MGLLNMIKNQLIDVIDWPEQEPGILVHRFNRHDNEIKMGAKLIVRPGQQAVFVNEGKIADGFGPGTYTLSTQNMPFLTTLLSLPYALGATTVIFGKHIDKLKEDRARRIFTLPVLLGEKAARFTAVGMIVLMYALVVFAVVRGDFSPWMLVTLAGLAYAPRPVAMLLRAKPAERPADYSAEIWPLWYVAGAFYHNRGFGMFFLLGLVLQFFLG